jgi:hypothetical protein
MATAESYRAEAKRCRDLAAQAVEGSAMAERWLTLAVEYDSLADALETPFRAASMKAQPMQQQQQKTTEDEN